MQQTLFLRLFRVEAGLSQMELGHRLGLDHTAISRLECGRLNPTPREGRALERFFGVPLDLLLTPSNLKETLVCGGNGHATA